MRVFVACQQPGAVSLAPHCTLSSACCRDDECHVVDDLPDAFSLPLFSLNQNDYGTSEGDSSVGIRSVGELGHYGLLPCAWSYVLLHDRSGGELGHYGLLPCACGYALMHDQADRPAALCGGSGLRSHAPTGVAALCGA